MKINMQYANSRVIPAVCHLDITILLCVTNELKMIVQNTIILSLFEVT